MSRSGRQIFVVRKKIIRLALFLRWGVDMQQAFKNSGHKNFGTLSASGNISTIKESMMSSRLVTTEELSTIISVPVWSLRKMIRDGIIPACKVGKKYLLDPEEVIQEIKTHRA